MTAAGCRAGSRSCIWPLARTLKTLGLTSSMPIISMGWEKLRVTSMLRPSACMTMVSEGMTIPKCAPAVPASNTIMESDTHATLPAN